MDIVVKKRTFATIKEYFIVMLIILATDSLWVRASFNSYNFYVIIIIGLLLGAKTFIDRKVYRKNLVILIMAFSIIITQLANNMLNMFLIYKVSIIFLGLWIITNIKFIDFIRKFINIMVVLALVSIITLMLRTFIINTVPLKIITRGTMKFHTMYITNFYVDSGGNSIMRNLGAFWEPGAYQAYLNLALIFLNFIVKKDKYFMFKNLILIITIFSTLSTTGIVCFLLFVVALILNKDKKSIGTISTVLLLFLCIILFLNKNSIIHNILFSKFSSDSTSYISYSTRLNAVLNEVNIIINSPLIGVGFNKYAAIYKELSSNLFMDAVTTCTSLAAWSIYGVIYFVCFNLGFIKIARKVCKSFLSLLIILVIFIVILNTEDWTFSLLFNILCIYGLNKTNVIETE